MPVEASRTASRTERIELILRELDTLPTLGRVAVRLLEVTADENAEAQEVIDLVASDPALASKVLSLCRCHERGRASTVASIDRAVLLLGFEAVRCAALSVQVFELMSGLRSPGGEMRTERPVFDRQAFWLHALGVAVAAERLGQRGTLTSDIRPSEAFMAGLLHDLGQLVLHVLLPESFDRVCRLAETHGTSLDRACRQLIGFDTHTPGKRLAEQWGLPKPLVDVIWLSGQPAEAVPALPHRNLVSLVSLSDALVRARYISPGAHWTRNEDLAAMCVPVGFPPNELDDVADALHEEVTRRAEALGMSNADDADVLLRAITRANESLARANAGLRKRERVSRRQGRALRALTRFYDGLHAGADLADVVGRIAQSAADLLETSVSAVLLPAPDGTGWRLLRIAPDGRALRSRPVEPPDGAIPLDAIVDEIPAGSPVPILLPWIAAHLPADTDLGPLRTLPITGDDAGRAVLLVGVPTDDADLHAADALLPCWRTGLAAATRHAAAEHLTEQLAESNRTLVDMQETVAHSRTLSTLGEVASGAAHEMNNPLTVISGRAQLLSGRLEDPEHRQMAIEIYEQSHRLSDMITALRSFAEPVEPCPRAVDLADLVVRVVQRHARDQRSQAQVNTVFAHPLPIVHTDPDLVGPALGELVQNALESKGVTHIELRVQTDPLDDRLTIEVRDDGEGMDEHTLRHAFDPFFSARPAGRQPGLGLARARRYIEAHGGQITLANGPGGGAVASIRLSRWRGPDESEEAA